MADPEKLTADIQLPNYAGTDPRLTTWRRQHSAPSTSTAAPTSARTGGARPLVAKAITNWRSFTKGGR